MEHTKLALSAVMIVAVGLIGTNFVTGLEMTEPEIDAIPASAQVIGHITIVHSDPDGNVVDYIQTDNFVALIGLDCLSELVFGDFVSNCSATTNNLFDTIGLFDGQSFPVTMNSSTILGQVLTTNGLEIANGTGITPTSFANATGTGKTISAGSKTDIANLFTTGSGVTNQNVDGAGLFNASPHDAMLAGQNFTPVSLSTSDTLLITWTIELG